MRVSTHSTLIFLLAIGGIATLFTTCEVTGEQNIDYRPGSSLTIVGPSAVEVPDTAEYFMKDFTINKEYVWTLNGTELDSTQLRREGEFADIIFTDPGTYTIEVNDGEYTGTLEVTATDTVTTP